MLVHGSQPNTHSTGPRPTNSNRTLERFTLNSVPLLQLPLAGHTARQCQIEGTDSAAPLRTSLLPSWCVWKTQLEPFIVVPRISRGWQWRPWNKHLQTGSIPFLDQPSIQDQFWCQILRIEVHNSWKGREDRRVIRHMVLQLRYMEDRVYHGWNLYAAGPIRSSIVEGPKYFRASLWQGRLTTVFWAYGCSFKKNWVSYLKFMSGPLLVCIMFHFGLRPKQILLQQLTVTLIFCQPSLHTSIGGRNIHYPLLVCHSLVLFHTMLCTESIPMRCGCWYSTKILQGQSRSAT